MSKFTEELNKKLKELFISEFNLTPEEFINRRDSYLLRENLEAMILVKPRNHYAVKKEVFLAKGCFVKLAERSKDHKFQPLGYSNYFFIEIVGAQIISLGDIEVKLESFIDAVKL